MQGWLRKPSTSSTVMNLGCVILVTCITCMHTDISQMAAAASEVTVNSGRLLLTAWHLQSLISAACITAPIMPVLSTADITFQGTSVVDVAKDHFTMLPGFWVLVPGLPHPERGREPSLPSGSRHACSGQKAPGKEAKHAADPPLPSPAASPSQDLSLSAACLKELRKVTAFSSGAGFSAASKYSSFLSPTPPISALQQGQAQHWQRILNSVVCKTLHCAALGMELGGGYCVLHTSQWAATVKDAIVCRM